MMIALIILLPLVLGMIIVAFFRDIPKLRYIAMAAGVAALALLPLISYGSTSVQWISIAGQAINLTISITPLSMLLLSLVLVIGLLVMVYSLGYIKSMFDQRRFYLEMLVFETAMVVFAMSGNFIVTFIAWEFLSLTSYLLIGFTYSRNSANRAARKAVTIVLIGDLALLGSMAVFWHVFGTLEFAQILSPVSATSSTDLTIGVLLLLTAIFSKSAQFPFHEWLVDAMEGPVPVSAYLHSSTMVKAGVFIAIILYPLFTAPAISTTIFAVSIITLVFSTLAALREMHIKKVIAYSTIQELSIMMLAISGGAVLAAIYFFFIQSFYKALLFFSSGVVIEATGKESLEEVSGLGTRKLIFISTLFGVLSLAGFVPFSGFFANEGLRGTAFQGGTLTYLLLSVISLLTSFYIVRWFSYLSRRNKKVSSIEGNYMTTPKSMVYPIVALAVLTLAASALFFSMEGFLNTGGYLSYLPIQSNFQLSIADGAVYTVLIAIGAILSYLVYYRSSIKASEKQLDRLIYTGTVVNLFYNIVALITLGLSAGMAGFDSSLSDVFDRIGALTVRFGRNPAEWSLGCPLESTTGVTCQMHPIRTIPSPRACFWKRAYNTFEFFATNPGVGCQRADLGFPEIRSWRISGFRRYLIFHRELPDRIQFWRVLHGTHDLHQTLGGP